MECENGESFESLTLNEEQNVILKSHRIVLPGMLCKIAVQLAHIGLLGIEKIKGLHAFFISNAIFQLSLSVT